MIKLRPIQEKELKNIVMMELQTHANKYVNSVGIELHKKNFKKPNIIYLSIDKNDEKLSGYFILANEVDSKSVEFRRIVIDENSLGIGQIAIKEMEAYCQKILKSRRIWLDVYEDNVVGKHIYEKMGYKKYKDGISDGRILLFYHKNL